MSTLLHLEKELKYELSKNSYAKLLKALKKLPQKTQRLANHYFDNPQLALRKRKFGLRVRVQNGRKASITLKYPANLESQKLPFLKIRHEYEQPIPMKLAHAILNGKKKIMEVEALPVRLLRTQFTKSQVAKVRKLGTLETVRTVIPLKRWIELEVDSYKIWAKRFYELEVETEQPSKVDKAIRELFKKQGIEYLPLSVSKLARFLKEWKAHR